MHQLKIQKALNPAYRKIKPNRRAVDEFTDALSACKEEIRRSEENNESEEHCKSHIKTFLKNSFYADHYINTKDRIDLAVYRGKSADSDVGVLLETKKLSNKTEFPTVKNLNKKAVQELLLYYLRERIDHQNNNIKQLVATNGIEWFLFKGEDFYAHFYKNKKLIKEYEAFRDGKKDSTNNELFYREIASKFINDCQEDLPFVHLDFGSITIEKLSDKKLNNLYKLFSPVQWLGEPFGNDSNQLNKAFYHELLHIIGLKEVKKGSKKVIERMPVKERSDGSLIENAIEHIDAKDKLSRFAPKAIEGKTREEKLFNLGLDLCITWINRILFLKLLEAQLLQYNNDQPEYSFLNIERIKDFDNLDALFFQVLAKRSAERTARVQKDFAHIPYLNSSLFETTDLEHQGLFISELDDYRKVSVYPKTQLVDPQGKKETGALDALTYLFRFLDAYDFAGDTEESIQEDNKTLINASVLGLIFEKINGYKEGSFFTPGFITMYMCRETVRKAVLQKFNQAYDVDLADFDDLKSYCYHYYKKEDKQAFNELIDSLKICDPAVGSGHFLVSALNELLAVKSELGILIDENALPLKVKIEVVNDELVITDEEGDLFEYQPHNRESARIQKSIFHEKQNIIENSLFGVDINANSVKICRLRLWIELLKHAYYKPLDEADALPQLETLPNIDINIKTGNSLISRFELDADLSKALKQSKWNLDSYRNAVITYRQAKEKEQKEEMRRIIQDIKSNFRSEINKNDPRKKRLEKARGELFNMTQQTGLFEQTKAQQKAWRNKVEKLNKQIKQLETDIEAIKNNKIYENAFEWRFEFPEVLNDQGDFIGFDIVIGNPPYIKEYEGKEIFDGLRENEIYQGKMDIWYMFASDGTKLLKKDGLLSFIASNNWVTNSGASKLRNFLLENTEFYKLIDFTNFMVFDTASIQTMIMIFRKRQVKTHEFEYRKIINQNPELADAESLIEGKKTENTLLVDSILKNSDSLNATLNFNAKEIEQVCHKLSSKDVFYLDKDEIAQGIVPNPDVVNSRNILNLNKNKIENNKVKVGDGVFTVDKNHFQNKILSDSDRHYLKSFQ